LELLSWRLDLLRPVLVRFVIEANTLECLCMARIQLELPIVGFDVNSTLSAD
jgi:hypothetical protein